MDVRNLFRKIKNPDEKIENDNEYTDTYYGSSVLKIDPAEEPAAETVPAQEQVAVPQTEPVKPAVKEAEPLAEPEEEKPVQVKYFTPKDNLAAPKIVEKLMEDCVVVIDISKLESDMFVRTFDYVMGAMQALNCEKSRIDDYHICIAKSMEDIQRFCENYKEAETEIMDLPDDSDGEYEDGE